MKACRTSRCRGIPSPSFAWCDPCLLAWGETRNLAGTLPAPLVVAVEPVPAPVFVLDVPPDGYHQCTNCTGLYPVLVDDVLCMRCDSILYPTSPVPRPAETWPATARLREAS